MVWLLVRDSGSCCFVNEMTVAKALYRERRVDRVRLIFGYRPGEDMR
jgi:hypothetical protein